MTLQLLQVVPGCGSASQVLSDSASASDMQEIHLGGGLIVEP